VRIILPFLYGCETWCLTLREEHRLKIFENSVLRKMLGPRGPEVTGGWRKLNNEGLLDFYLHLTNIIYVIKSMICDGRGTWQFWEEAKRLQGFVVETWSKEPHGRPRRTQENSIQLIWEKRKGWHRVGHLAEDRDKRAVVKVVINLRLPQNAGHLLTSWGFIRFSRRTLIHEVSWHHLW